MLILIDSGEGLIKKDHLKKEDLGDVKAGNLTKQPRWPCGHNSCKWCGDTGNKQTFFTSFTTWYHS